MDKLKKSATLDYHKIESFIGNQGKTVDDLILWHDHIMSENEDGQLVLVEAEMRRCGVVLIVTDLLDSGWMVETCFLPDGTITRNKTR